MYTGPNLIVIKKYMNEMCEHRIPNNRVKIFEIIVLTYSQTIQNINDVMKVMSMMNASEGYRFKLIKKLKEIKIISALHKC